MAAARQPAFGVNGPETKDVHESGHRNPDVRVAAPPKGFRQRDRHVRPHHPAEQSRRAAAPAHVFAEVRGIGRSSCWSPPSPPFPTKPPRRCRTSSSRSPASTSPSSAPTSATWCSSAWSSWAWVSCRRRSALPATAPSATWAWCSPTSWASTPSCSSTTTRSSTTPTSCRRASTAWASSRARACLSWRRPAST